MMPSVPQAVLRPAVAIRPLVQGASGQDGQKPPPSLSASNLASDPVSREDLVFPLVFATGLLHNSHFSRIFHVLINAATK
jgi:hypothetical protein